MANEYGLELVIPDGFLEKLRQADEELEFTAMQAEETKTRVIKAFKDMGDLGVDYFLKKLKDMQKVMSEISSKNITLKGLESSAKGAAKAADDVVKVAEAFGQVSRESPRVDGGLKNIDEVMVRMMNDIKTTRQELTLYDEFLKRNVISLEEYKRGVDVTSERLESMMRQYEALDKARVSLSGMDGNDLAVQRKNDELSRLNEAYRTGTSELQKQAKAEDEQAKKLQQQQKEQERLAKQQQREDERRQKTLEKQQKEQERLNKLKEEEQRKTYQGAMAYSSNAKNIMEDVQAIKYLEAARSKLNRTDSDYAQKLATLNNAILQHKKNIADAKGETLNLEKQQRSLINTGDQLRRKLGLIFSVSAITGYIKKMVEVRGEFELQKVALTAILQNKEKADELWARTQELALQSPFRLSQLVTFTKQLAAYQVEADKLYETNKRLADVSAGLGVDMGRLILAFGQVKAANYLRSAEIRQFTEAGINMLGELSKLYTELEGKMVSVGEVQERVQKRMVSFGDVEEVFKRLTDAGGMFYNMQEKQSETLKGMIAKLGDALDIMLNKIGEANEGVLKGAVTIILQVLQSWNKIGDVVVPILSMIITRMAAIKVYTKFLQTPQLFGVLINGLREVLVRVGAVKMSFGELRERIQRDGSAMKISAQGWITIITAVIAVIWELHNALSSLNKQQKELDRISLSVQHEANASVRRYKELVEIIKDSTKSYQSQKDALDELRRTYGEILPSEYLEIENIRNIKEGYDAAKEAILSYYQVSARQKEIDFILNEGDGKKMQERQTALIKRIMTAVKAQRPEYEVIQRDIRQFVDSIAEEYKRGEITIQDAEVKLKESLEEFYNIKFPRNPFVQYGGDVGRTKNFWDLFAGSLANLKSSLDDVMSSEFWGMPNRMSITLQDAEKTFEENSKIIQTSFNMMLDWDKLSDAQKESALANLKGFYDSLGEQMPDWSNIVKDPLRFDEETRRFNQLWLKSMEESVRGTYSQIYTDISNESGAAYAVWENFREGLEQKINSQNLEDWQNLVISGIYKFAEANDIALTGMNGIVLKSGQTMDDYFKGIQGDVDRLKQDIGQAKLDRENFPNALQPTSDESLTNMEEQLALYEYIMSLYYDANKADKQSDKDDREALNLLKERVQLIQEMNKEYEKNKEYLSEEAAWEKVIESYEKHFNELFAGTGIRLKKAILNSDAIEAAIEVGREAGEGLTDAMKEQLEKIAESGEIIRKYSEEGIMQLLQDEGKTNQAVNIGDNKWTIGVGFTEGVKKGDYMSDEEIIERLQSELEKHQKWLNDVLDGYQELYLTQEQYDSLFNLTYQGGKGAAEQLLRRAFDESQAIEYFAKVDRQAQKTLGKSLNSMIAEFNKTEEYDWVENFKGLDNVYDKISELLKIMNLTVKKGQISAQLIGGMGSRSARRSASFAGGKELSQWVTGMIEWGRDVDFTSLQGVYETLSKIPVDVGYKLREEALRFMEGTKAKVGVEIDLDTSKLNLKDLKTQVEELFDGIDIFQDLVKIGFTEDEVRRIFGIEITNTEQLRRRLEDMKDEFVGTKGIDDYNAFMRKIDEMEDKQNVERLKRYEKYLKTMMSETAEIRIQALQDIQDVMKMSGRSSEEKSAIIEGINREAQKKLQEQQWKQFQESDDYQLLFYDIEHLSTTTASRLKDILDNLRTSLNELTPHQLRQIQAQYEKLDEQIIKHNPFEAVKESMQAIKGLASESKLNETMLGLTGRKEETQQAIDDIDVMLSMIEKGIKYDTLDAKKQEELAEYRKLSKEELLAMRKEQEAMLDDIMVEMGLTEGQINLYKRLRKAMSEADNTWQSVMSSTRQALSDIKGAYEAMNDGAQSITLEIIDAGIALADAAHNAVTLYKQMVTLEKEGPAIGAALNSALGIIGLIATAVQTVINVINTIASAYDEDLENDIKDYEHSVNKLADAYDRLSDKIQKAYSFAMLATSTNQGLTNLQEQVVAYENMIEAERDKKDSDNERIQEWTDKVEELRAKMEETKNAAVREAGGIGGEYKDAAQGFVDAWMQAFRETGNGLDALNQHFEDFLWEIAGKQVLLRAADRFFEPLFTELNTRMSADTQLYDEKIQELESGKKKWEVILKDYSEIEEGASKADKKHYEKQIEKAKENIDDYNRQIKEIEEAREQAIQDALTLDEEDFDFFKQWGETNIPLISDNLKKLVESLGFKGGEGGEALSGLQKGIQSITESTAEIIEAYLNSVRFFVSDSNQKLTELLERFASADGARSPILAELRAQTSYLNSIDRALSTIIDPSGWRNGGGVLKVMM